MPAIVLPTAAFLTAFGFVAWILGYVFDHPEFSIIGAILILGVGVLTATGGLERKTGETRVTNSTTNTTDVSYTYAKVEPPDHLPLGELIMLLGGVGVLQSINRLRE